MRANVSAFVPFQRLVALYGAVNSLTQAVLKVAVPGIPDFYQGTELWSLSLVDPDNRRPVDFARRQTLLDSLAARIADRADGLEQLGSELLEAWPDGRIKLYVTQRALTLRRERERLFRSGSYTPLSASGKRAEHLVGLARRDEGQAVIVVNWQAPAARPFYTATPVAPHGVTLRRRFRTQIGESFWVVAKDCR